MLNAELAIAPYVRKFKVGVKELFVKILSFDVQKFNFVFCSLKLYILQE